MNPQFIQTIPHSNPNPNPKRSQTFTVNFFSQSITTVVTATPAVAREWVYTLRQNYHEELNNATLVIGLGVQWRPTFSSDAPEAATLQLCVDSDCLIFQLQYAFSVPATLRRLLVDDRVTFVGVHNACDEYFLNYCRHELQVGTVVDLAIDQGWRNTSMEEMAAEVLGYENIVKPRWLGISDWDRFWLSSEQVQYACVDALLSYLLAHEFGYPHCMYEDDDFSDEDDDFSDEDEDEDDDSSDKDEYDDFCGYCKYEDDEDYNDFDWW